MREELLEAIEILDKEDRDIDSLAVYLNLNYEYYINPYEEVSKLHKEIERELEEMIEEGIIKKEILEIETFTEEGLVSLPYQIFSKCDSSP